MIFFYTRKYMKAFFADDEKILFDFKSLYSTETCGNWDCDPLTAHNYALKYLRNNFIPRRQKINTWSNKNICKQTNTSIHRCWFFFFAFSPFFSLPQTIQFTKCPTHSTRINFVLIYINRFRAPIAAFVDCFFFQIGFIVVLCCDFR